METRTLIMFFVDQYGSKFSMSVDDPKLSLDPFEVKSAMESLITNKVFVGKNGAELIEAHSAQIVVRTVNPLKMD